MIQQISELNQIIKPLYATPKNYLLVWTVSSMTNKSLIISHIKVLHVLKIKLIRIPQCNTPTRRSYKASQKSLNLKLLLSRLQFYSSLGNSLVYFTVFSLYYLPALHQSHSNIDYSLMLYQGVEDSGNIANYLVLFRGVIK